MTKKHPSIYGVHPAIKMIQSWTKNLPIKTGKTLEEWIEYVKESGPASEQERREWLKKEHGFGTNGAIWLAERADGKGMEDGDPDAYLQAAEGYVENLFSGSKASLRPIYDELLRVCLELGPDVRICPCKTIIPFYRNHVFAEIKPTTRTRIDLGLALKEAKPIGLLIDTGGFAKKHRITYRIPLSSVSEINDEVLHWLKIAYDLDA